MIGRDGLHPPCAASVSAGPARATQMPEMLRHAAGRVVPPLGNGKGVLLAGDGGDYRVEPLD